MSRLLTFTFSTPPPSLNNSKRPRRDGRGMVSSLAYVRWQVEARAELARQPGSLPDPCYWRSDILIPAGKTKADLDNLLKPIHDLLVKAGRVPDDRYKVDARIRFHGGGDVVVAIKQENLEQWQPIRKPSKSLLRKLAKSSG